MMTDPSYAQRVAVRSIQTLFCYARGTEGATRAAAGASASAMRSLFILAVLLQLEMGYADRRLTVQAFDPLRKPPRQPSGDLESNFRTPGVHLRQSELQNLGERRPRPRHAVLIASPHATAA